MVFPFFCSNYFVALNAVFCCQAVLSAGGMRTAGPGSGDASKGKILVLVPDHLAPSNGAFGKGMSCAGFDQAQDKHLGILDVC